MEKSMAKSPIEIWRDGPVTNPHQPFKPDIRDWALWLESMVTSGILSSGPWFSTKASMTLGYDANTIAIVYNDPTAANNGLYIKVGASGSGSWTQLTSFLPGYQFVTASPTGASTANAIVASTSPRLPSGDGVALVTLAITATNTATPVTVRFDGGAVLTIKTRTGEDPDAGELQQNDVVAGFVSGATFRLISDLNSLRNAQVAKAWADNNEDAPVPASLGGDGVNTFSAKHWAAKSEQDADRSDEEADRSEVARLGAEAARDIAAGYASDAVSQGSVPIYGTAVGLAELAIEDGINFIRTNGYYAAGDFGAAKYRLKLAIEIVRPGDLVSNGASKRWEISEAEPTPEMFGAKGDGDGTLTGGTDDLAAFQDAVDYSDRFFLKRSNCSYRLHGILETNRFTSIIGFSAANSDDSQLTSAPKLIFTGSGAACIRTKSSVNVSSHSRWTGFVLRAIGTYDWMIDLKGCVDSTFDNFRIETTSLSTGGFRSKKNNLNDNSWTNGMWRIGIRLPDGSGAHALHQDWSDSDIINCQITGGAGSVDAGYGVRFIGCQLERSNGVGLLIDKVYAAKNTRVIGCFLDANKTHGIALSTVNDNSTNYVFNVAVIGSTFRTFDVLGTGAGVADIGLLNPSANTYSPGTFDGNTHELSAVPPILNSGPWAGAKIVGPHTQSAQSTFFSLADMHLWVSSAGIRVPYGAVIATGAKTLNGQANCSGFFGGSNPGAAGAALGNDGSGAFIAATKTSGGLAQRLAFYVNGAEMLRLAASGAVVQPSNDNVVSLGGTSNRFKDIFAGTPTISTSDERVKSDIEPIPDVILDAWESVEWVQFRFVGGERLHTGLIAQRVKQAFEAKGLDATKYGLLCHDEWGDVYEERRQEVLGADGKPQMQLVELSDEVVIDGQPQKITRLIEEPVTDIVAVLVRAAGDLWSVRYEEALAMEAALMRRTVERLKAKIS